MKEKSKIYITTAIDYVNAEAHLGHALEKVQADALARYQREKEMDVFFLTGTDENSLSTVRAAKEKKIPVEKFVQEKANAFLGLKEKLNLSIDDFIRTSEKRHEQAVSKLWGKAKKDIYLKNYSGLLCSSCEAYYKKEEAPDGLCPIHGKELELVEEENYFFKLSRYQKQLRKIIETDEIKVLPESRKNEVLGFIDQGLEDICISRSAERLQGWGIDVPGDKSQKIWCWFDALTNYISALDYGKEGKKFKEWWVDNPLKVHCIGKDILKFHAVYWPAFLLSAGLPLPQIILTHGWLTVDGQKMSKSAGTGTDPVKLVKEYGIDAVRYFLLREIPSSKDGDFSLAKFKERYNADLAGGLGNLVARVTKLAKEMKVEAEPTNLEAIQAVKEVQKEYAQAMDNYDFREALMSIWNLIAFCDQYIEQEEPWKGEDGAPVVVANLLSVLGKITFLLKPFLPDASQRMADQLSGKQKKESLFPRLK
jgi:methionyl-tRNA synthetase